MKKYQVTAHSNYNDTTWSNKRKAIAYARSITDSTNPSTTVTCDGQEIAKYIYTPEMGGRTFKAQL